MPAKLTPTQLEEEVSTDNLYCYLRTMTLVSGLSVIKISTKLGYCPQATNRILKQLNIPTLYTEYWYSELAQLHGYPTFTELLWDLAYYHKLSSRQISFLIPLTPKSVRNKMKELGIPRLPRGGANFKGLKGPQVNHVRHLRPEKERY